MAREAKTVYVTVKHGRVTLLCRPLLGQKNAFRSVATFVDDGEVAALIAQHEESEK